MRILEKEIKYIDKLIEKSERSIRWAEGKPGVSPVELQNLKNRLVLEKKIHEVLCKCVVNEIRAEAERRVRTSDKKCSNCFHHNACLRLIVPEDETLILCENFVPFDKATVLPLSLGGTVYDKKGVPYIIYRIEGDGEATDFEYTAYNGSQSENGEMPHLYFYIQDIGINVFLEDPAAKINSEGSGADE